jgi:hypothetical protein
MVVERAAFAFPRWSLRDAQLAPTAAAVPMTMVPSPAAPPLTTVANRCARPVPGLSPLHLDWVRERLRVELQAIKTLGHCSRTRSQA